MRLSTSLFQKIQKPLLGSGWCSCRSELAREERNSAAFIQADRVIVNVHREQARSYIKVKPLGVKPQA
jgi:hypothetical protein